jgi:hypothetical protein
MWELEGVVLLEDRPDRTLAAGDVGTDVHGAGEAYEVAFTTLTGQTLAPHRPDPGPSPARPWPLTGQTLAVPTLRPPEVRAISERDPMQVRQAGVA